MKDWIRSQQSTPLHFAAILLFPLVVFFSYQSTVLLIVGYVAFFLATSLKMIWKMVIIMAIVAIAVMVLPFLAPIALIVMIVLFIMRIGYVFKNWRPFVSGLTVYGSSIYLWGRAHQYWGYSLTEPIVMAILSGVFMHFLLRWLYRHGYSSVSALGIMGSVPLIIISFVLPFLKMHVSLDAFGETYTEAKHVTSEPYVNKYTNVTETASHPRTTYVESYVRTAPDGDPTNNLSYNGPDAKPPNMQDMQVVKGHFRTVPDGDPTNNLSYHQQAATTESVYVANGDTTNSGYESQPKYQSGNEQNDRLATVVYVEQDKKRKN